MEKLAYGLSILTVLYIVFLFLTAKVLIKDSSVKSFSSTDNTKKIKPKDEETRPI